MGSRRRGGWLGAFFVAWLGAIVLVGHVAADARTDYLVRLLRTSTAFRVRAQAALSMGELEPAPELVAALTGALDDQHPAVRIAAAHSLERLGDPGALDALHAARQDADRDVRVAIASAIRTLRRIARTRPTSVEGSGTVAPPPTTVGNARYYVGVGMPGTKNLRLDPAIVRVARDVVAHEAAGIAGVEVAPEQETNAQARAVIQRRRLAGYYLDASIVSVETNGTGTRAVVSIIVATYPGRDMRSILQGAATVPGGRGPDAERQAIEGALRGALRRLGQALEASSGG
jgi:HEAT repeat protein